MAKIPIYQSNERLTTESPSVRRNLQIEGQAGRNLGASGKAIVRAGQAIKDAYDFQQIEEAKLKTIEGISAIEQKAVEDGDNTGDLRPYEDDLGRLKNDVLKGISSPALKNRFSMNLDLHATQTKTKIKSIFCARMKDKGIDTMNCLNEIYVQEYAETGNKNSFTEIENNVKKYVKMGFINADDAEKIINKTIKDAKRDSFLYDVLNDRKKAEKKLQDNEYGFDIKDMTWANNNLTYQSNKQKYETRRKLDNLWYKGHLTYREIDDAYRKGDITQKMRQRWIKIIDDPTYDFGTDVGVFNDLLYKIKNPASDKVKVYGEISDAFFGEKLSRDAYKELLTDITPDYVQLMNKQRNQEQTPQERGIFASIKYFFRSRFTDTEKARMAKQLIKMVANSNYSEEDIYKKAQDILRGQIKEKYPGILDFPKEGQKVIDENGNIKVVFPTGELRPVATKGKK